MKIGTVYFVIGDSFISKLIQRVDGKFSHVAIAISETEVIETNWNIHSKVKVPDYRNCIAIDLNLSAEQQLKLIQNYQKYLGRPYDFFQIIGLFFKLNLNNKRKLICSELVYNLLVDCGYLKNEGLSNISPNGLYNLLAGEGKINK